jgi:hypothetical protein
MPGSVPRRAARDISRSARLSPQTRKPPSSGGFAVRPERFELPTFGSVDRRSIQLSYGREDGDCSRAVVKAARAGGQGSGTGGAAGTGDIGSGEGGIRTRDRGFPPYSLSRRVPSATRPPLRSSSQCRTAPPTRIAPDRRGGRAVECTGLENRSPVTRTAGSNPAPSAQKSAVPSHRRLAADPAPGQRGAGRLIGAVPNTWSQNGALTP